MTATLEHSHTRDQAEMMLTLDRALAALRILPTRPSEIAAWLHELGCRGHVGDELATALECYLEASTGLSVILRRDTAEWGGPRWAFTLDLAPEVTHFQWSYDSGDYDELYGDPTPGDVAIIAVDELAGLGPVEV